MKNNILTHKIIPILAIFILCFFSICVTNVNASYTTVINDKEYILPDTVPDNFVMLYMEDHKGDLIGIFWPTNEGVFNITSSGVSHYLYCYTDDTFTTKTDYSFIYLTDMNATDFSDCTVTTRSTDTQVQAIDNLNDTIVYSSYDLYQNGTVFFQGPPLTLTETIVEETTKAQVMEQLKIMILGFLKYLIVLVISVIAFWKGWQLLSTALKKA